MRRDTLPVQLYAQRGCIWLTENVQPQPKCFPYCEFFGESICTGFCFPKLDQGLLDFLVPLPAQTLPGSRKKRQGQFYIIYDFGLNLFCLIHLQQCFSNSGAILCYHMREDNFFFLTIFCRLSKDEYENKAGFVECRKGTNLKDIQNTGTLSLYPVLLTLPLPLLLLDSVSL